MGYLKGLFLATSVALLLSGCNDKVVVQKSGKVIDGYISGATVCIDLNSNGSCDENEPKAKTDNNGYFLINSNVEIPNNASIIAYGGVDLDTNKSFEGVLSSPIEYNNITPITTLIDNYLKENQIDSLEKAEEKLSKILSIPKEALRDDPIERLKKKKEAKLLKTAIKVQKLIELASSLEESNNTKAQKRIENIYKRVAKILDKTNNIVDAINKAIEKKEIKEASKTLAKFIDESNVSSEKDRIKFVKKSEFAKKIIKEVVLTANNKETNNINDNNNSLDKKDLVEVVNKAYDYCQEHPNENICSLNKNDNNLIEDKKDTISDLINNFIDDVKKENKDDNVNDNNQTIPNPSIDKNKSNENNNTLPSPEKNSSKEHTTIPTPDYNESNSTIPTSDSNESVVDNNHSEELNTTKPPIDNNSSNENNNTLPPIDNNSSNENNHSTPNPDNNSNCSLNLNLDNSNFTNTPPNNGKNIKYFTIGTRVSDIETAFNYARSLDSTINGKKLKLPSQEIWDSLSKEEQALYILNQERIDRGLKPFEGVLPLSNTTATTLNSANSLAEISQAYANLLYTKTSLSHNLDGKVSDRLNKVANLTNRESVPFNENLYADGNNFKLNPIPLIKAIYQWIYADAEVFEGNPWDHRAMCLMKIENDNFGKKGAEGIISFGLKQGNNSKQNPNGYKTSIVVMNAFNPDANWSGNYKELKCFKIDNSENKRFLRDEKGYILDKNTSLMWQDMNITQKSCDDIEDYCQNLEFAGFSDWRAPSASELSKFYKSAIANGITPNLSQLNTIKLTAKDAYVYTEYGAKDKNKPIGYIEDGYASSSLGDAKCVRGKSNETPTTKGDFEVDNTKGVIVDKKRNLTWQNTDLGKMTPDYGKIYCNNLNLADYNNWRMPSVDELKAFHIETNASGIEPKLNFSKCVAEYADNGKTVGTRAWVDRDPSKNKIGDVFNFSGSAGIRCVRDNNASSNLDTTPPEAVKFVYEDEDEDNLVSEISVKKINEIRDGIYLNLNLLPKTIKLKAVGEAGATLYKTDNKLQDFVKVGRLNSNGELEFNTTLEENKDKSYYILKDEANNTSRISTLFIDYKAIGTCKINDTLKYDDYLIENYTQALSENDKSCVKILKDGRDKNIVFSWSIDDNSNEAFVSPYIDFGNSFGIETASRNYVLPKRLSEITHKFVLYYSYDLNASGKSAVVLGANYFNSLDINKSNFAKRVEIWVEKRGLETSGDKIARVTIKDAKGNDINYTLYSDNEVFRFVKESGNIESGIYFNGFNKFLIDNGYLSEDLVQADIFMVAVAKSGKGDLNITQYYPYPYKKDCNDECSYYKELNFNNQIPDGNNSNEANSSSKIVLNGDNPTIVILGNDYKEAGAKFEGDENLTIDINNSSVNVSKLGEYILKYSAKDGNKSYEATRVVKVVSPEYLVKDLNISEIKCNSWANIKVGENTFNNNDWGRQYLSEDKDGVQCIFSFNDNGELKGGWLWGWPDNNDYQVKGYPEAIYGAKFKRVLNPESGFPALVSEIKSVNVNIAFRDLNYTKRYNTALEFWLHTSKDTSMDNIEYEIMFRFDPNGFHPNKTNIGTYTIDGVVYDVYKDRDYVDGETNRIFINFVAQKKVNSVNVDFKKALDYLTNLEFKDIPQRYMSGIEMGVEMISGSGVLLLDKMSVSLNKDRVKEALNSKDASKVSITELRDALKSAIESSNSECIERLNYIYPNGVINDYFEGKTDQFITLSEDNIPLHGGVENQENIYYSFMGKKGNGARYAMLGTPFSNFKASLIEPTKKLFAWLSKNENALDKNITILANDGAKDDLNYWFDKVDFHPANWHISTDLSLLESGDFDIYIARRERSQNYKKAIELKKGVIKSYQHIIL